MSKLKRLQGLPTWWIVAVLCLLGPREAPVFAQELPADRFEVMVRFNKGRLVCDRSTLHLELTPEYRQRLRPGVSDARLQQEFADAIDREFRLMPKPYFYTLTDDQKKADRANLLNDNATINAAREWNGEWRQFPGLDFFNLSAADFAADLNNVAGRSGVARYVARDPDDFSRLTRVFGVRDVFRLEDIQLLPDDRRFFEKLLGRLEGLPGNPDAIRAILLNYYAVRGITPRVDIDLDSPSKRIRVVEADRIAHLLLPLEIDKQLDTQTKAELIVYETMPDRVYHAFRKRSAAILADALDSGARKRTVDIGAIVRATEPPGAPDFKLPLNDAVALQAEQQRLIPLGYQGSLFDFDPSRGLVDLVIDQVTVQEGAATAANPVLGSAETPENASDTTSRPGVSEDIQPTPVTPRTRIGDMPSAGNTPRRDQKTFIGGGIEYRPEQGIRAFGTAHRRDLFGRDQLTATAGAQGSGIGVGRYVRDYVAFGALHRRLSLDVNGGTDFTQNRILDGGLTGERRSGAAGRGELELFRDKAGHQLLVSAEGRYGTVTLTPVATPGLESAWTMTTFDLGLTHQWNRRVARRPASWRVSPSLRLASAEPSAPATGRDTFQRLQADAAYHTLLVGSIDADVRARGEWASTRTPVFELPSLGTDGTVRGFRMDDALGRSLWSVQNELWFPLPFGSASSGFIDFVRRNLRVAGFYDLGAMHHAVGTEDGLRQGVGGGLRMRYQGVILAFDWARGFGTGAQGDARGRTYFTIRVP